MTTISQDLFFLFFISSSVNLLTFQNNAVITPSESNYFLRLYLFSMKASKYASIKECHFLLLVFILLILSAQF